MFVESAIKSDAEMILQLIREKAEFDGALRGSACEVTTSIEKIERTLFGKDQCAQALLARTNDQEVIGLTLYHTRYSSFSGFPSIWLDDLYVNSSSRSMGVGLQMMNHLKQRGDDIMASHISWTASLANIRGQEFYNRLGAEIDATDEKLIYYRLVI